MEHNRPIADLQEWKKFLLPYKFALDELKTKVNIMAEEAELIYEYNPIEHLKSRIKTPESIIKKLQRKQYALDLAEAKEKIFDIAGLRIICSFTTDIYTIYRYIVGRTDLKVVEVRDYIENPKPNGYQSLHIIVQIPITLSSGIEHVYAEIQLRTLAMDFWASLEHKIYYKYNKKIPDHLEKELLEAAQTAALMDKKMKHIHDEIQNIDRTEVYSHLFT